MIKDRYAGLTRSMREGLRPIAAWHAGLTPREKRLVAGAGAVAAVFLVYTILIEPAWNDIQRAADDLPKLRAQAATIASLTGEARRLQQQSGRQAGSPASAADLDESLRRASLPAGSWAASSAATDTGKPATWQIKFEAAPSDALMRWMDTLAGDLHLRVANVDLQRASSEYGRPIPGKVNGTVVLAPPVPAGGH